MDCVSLLRRAGKAGLKVTTDGEELSVTELCPETPDECIGVLLRGFKRQNRELVSAQSGYDVGPAERIPKRVRHGQQGTIADVMTECVIDGLEAVDVEQDKGSRLRGAAGELEILLTQVMKSPPVVQFGEAIDQRQTPKGGE